MAKILAVDDEPAILEMIESILNKDGHLVNDSTIITHIKNIRAKFADYDYMPIKTVWGIGYKWEE